MEERNKILAHKKEVTPHGRVQRLFGVYVPLKKIPKPKKTLTLRFCITGTIPSKKNDYYPENNYRMIAKKAFASPNPMQYLYDHLKCWIRGSEKYLKWCDDIIPTITDQARFWAEKWGLTFPLADVQIKTTYYFADTRQLDLINKDESVYDMLVKAGIMLDDNYGVLHKTSAEGYCCKGEIVDNVCVIDLTYMIF